MTTFKLFYKSHSLYHIISSITIFYIVPLIAMAQAPTTCDELKNLINKIGFALEGLAGAVAVIMILVAAFTYMTAGDDAQKVKKAHATITWAVVGVFVAMISYFVPGIVESFVGSNLGVCP